MKNRLRTKIVRRYAASVAIICMYGPFSGAAIAQDRQNGREDAAQNSLTQSNDAAIGDIIVTAQKRSENLQRTPAAVTFVGAEEIRSRQLLDITALASFAPSVRTNYENTAAQFFIRGVGQQVDRAGVPQAVAFVQDGIFIPAHVAGVGLYDVQNIQILPGPQGTLYGSSAIGGVIQVTTNRPTRDLEGSLLVEAGNYGLAHVTAIGNAPVAKDLSLRLVYDGIYCGGYFNNGTGNDKRTGFRLSSLYEPAGSTFSLLLKAGYVMDHARSQPSVPFPFQTSPAYDVPKFDAATAFFYPPNGIDNSIGRLNIDVLTLSGTAAWKVGGIDFSLTSGYVQQRQPGLNQAVTGGLLVPQTYEIDLFSNELRLSNSTTARLNWIVGFFQQYNKISEDYVFGPNLTGLDDDTKYKTYALFGQATYSVLEGTRLTGGLRLSQDMVSTRNATLIFPTFPGFGRGTQMFSFSQKYRRVNFKAGVEHDLGSRSMLYGAIQSGFNPGTYNGNFPNPDSPVKPQSMIGYTLGLKNRFLDSRLQLNIEGFLYNYKDQIITTSDQSTGINAALNASRSRIYGVQVDAVYRPTTGTSLHANVGYLNARFTDFVVPFSTGPIDYSGYTMTFSPNFTANLGGEQIVDIGEDSGSLALRVDTYLSTAFELAFDHPANFRQGGFSRTDASITYRSPGDRWEIGIWAKNLEDKAIVATGGTVQGRSYPGVVFLDPPRTFGGRLSIKFN